MTEDELRVLADNATFLYERLAGGWVADDTPTNRQAAKTRLERWCHLAAGGDKATFARRLAWLGLSLRCPEPVEGSKPTLNVESARLLLCDGHLADRDRLPDWTAFLDEALTQPFDDSGVLESAAFVQPFVATAQSRLASAVGDCLTWLSPLAQAHLADHLADRLAALSRSVLAHHPLLLETQTLYRAYPVLARQLCSAALQWVECVQEFLSRLAADWPALAAQIRTVQHPAPGCVATISPGLSDPHRGGRTVWRVELAGASVAYKPKDLALDRAWNDLLGWCNARGLMPALHPLWTLPRDGYGWMAWAEGSDTPDPPLLYRRVGVLLGLLHLLHASDVHGENLIFQANHPLLIDAEMLLYPQVAGLEAADPLDVLRTGLLPRWIVGREEIAEIGGLPGEAASAHREEIVAGYEDICRFTESHGQALSAVDGPLAAFRTGQVRFAPRPTAAYTRLLEHLRHPAFLQRGSDFSVEADRLARTYTSDPQRERLRHLLEEEHAALAQGDVPVFTAAVGGTDGVESVLHWPPLNPPAPLEVAQQSHLIRTSLDRSRYLSAPARGEPSFLSHALHLGELLIERAIPLEGGGVGWVGVQFQSKSGLHQHGLIGDDLYAGRAGIALFLAGLYRVTGAEKWREMGRAALHQPAATDDAGGRLYALALCNHLLAGSDSGNRPDVQGDSGDLVANSRNHQRVWGVLDGQAGELLGLLALYHQTGNGALLARAVACGDGLLAGSEEWQHPTHGLGGFSHGAAGIAYTLARLYEASGEARFLAGARRGWDFQRGLYDPAAGNWQDRRGATPVYLHNWCNGAAGIGLAAAGSLAVLPELADVAEQAGALLLAAESPFLDTLCCGGFGQIDCLLEMGRLLNRREWIEQASVQARATLERASGAGSFALYDDLPAHLFNPAFFRGVAGIGYTLLLLAGANGETETQLPCVLSWSAQ